MKAETLKIFHFPYLHSIMPCGIILEGKLVSSKKVFHIQGGILRIIVATKGTTFCTELF
jgi:hypothetical protein